MTRLPPPHTTAVREARQTREFGSRIENRPAGFTDRSNRQGGFALAEALEDLQEARDTLRKLEVQGKEAQRKRSAQLEMLSHDFRTPLQAMFGYTELLERGVHGPLNDEQLRDLHRLQHSHNHLLGLVDQLLEYSRLDGPSA